jgi:ribonuclease BN (tRNA processing enzyme)
MTAGGLQKRGALFAPDECINGENRVILSYLREFPQRIELLKPGHRYLLGDLAFTASVRLHHSAETYGILFDVDGRKLSFLPDTKYFPALLGVYRGSDLLVMNVVRYAAHRDIDILHLSLDDVRQIVRAVRPKKTLLTHLVDCYIYSLNLAEPICSDSRRKERGVSTAIRERRATQSFGFAQDGEPVEPKLGKGALPEGNVHIRPFSARKPPRRTAEGTPSASFA